MNNFPKTLGACVDRLYKLREARLKAQAEVDLTKEQEEILRQHILHNFAEQDLENSGGRVAKASITRRVVAQVQDWDKFFAWVGKTKSWDMVQRRVNDTAYRARLDEQVEVPGTEPFTVVSLSVVKR